MPTRFRLARVLRLRTQLRRAVQDEVTLLGAELASLRAQADTMRARQGAVHDAVEQALAGGGTTGGDLLRWGAWQQALAARESALAVDGERVAQAIARGREELLVRRREERKLERLRERAGARAVAEVARQEALLLDDLALRRRSETEGR
jgi:flagellar export protein FliJ